MKNILKGKLATVAISLLVLSLCSCSEEEVNIEDLNETLFVRHNNADMPAHIHGNGTDKTFLIILHGGPGGNGLWYRMNTIRTEIEKNNAVVYFDQRGSGNSQGNYSKKDVNVDLMAEDILALAKVIKAKYGDDSKLFLLGHSWGGTLGTAVLLKNQDVFSGWIDVAGVHDPKGTYNAYKTSLNKTANEQIALSNSVDYWKSTLDLVQNTSSTFKTKDHTKLNSASIEGEAKLEEDRVINKVRIRYGEGLPLNNDAKLSWNQAKMVRIIWDRNGLNERVSFTDQLSKITIPSLVLWGKYDLTVPTVFAQEAFENLGSVDKEIFIFEKSGHSPMASEPDLFSEKIIEFINTK